MIWRCLIAGTRCRVWLTAGALLALPPAYAAACEVPAELMQVDAKLPHLSARLRAGGPVTIVAIGGSSTAGAAAGSTDLAYPHRMQEALAGWYPSAPVTVINRGVPHQSAQQMLARFPADVLAAHPVLVIWETGATDAVRGIDVDEFAGTLQTGADELRARSIDLIFVNMQFSERITAVVDFERYLKAIYRVADFADLYVFPRYEIMRYWSEQNMFNFDNLAKAERALLAAKIYQCLGLKLAEAIRTALR